MSPSTPFGVAGPGVDEDAAVAGATDDRFGEPRRTRERTAGLAILDQLEPDHQPPAADLADGGRRRRADPRERGLEPVALRRARLDQVLVLEDPEDLAGDGGAGRGVGVSEAVDEAAVVQR